MNINASRFVIEINNNNHDMAAILMLKEAVNICKEMKLGRITLLVPAKKTFPGTRAGVIIDDVIGSGASKSLCSGNMIDLDGIKLHLESIDTFSVYNEYELLVSIYLSKGLDVFDAPSRVAALIYLPWIESEGKAWLSTWDAKVLGHKTWQCEPLQLDEPVVEALQDLTRSINLSTGLINDSDKKSALIMFADFRKKKLHPDPEGIRRWALRHGWEPKYARELARQAEIHLKHN